MKSSSFYRIAAALLALFAIGHQLGFRSVDSASQGDAARGMQTTQFTVQGFTRSYWDFFSGFGFFVTAFLVFSAVLAWELGRVRAGTLRPSTLVLWAFAACYVVIAIVAWMRFFMAPGIFASAIALCLILAAIAVNGERLV